MGRLVGSQRPTGGNTAGWQSVTRKAIIPKDHQFTIFQSSQSPAASIQVSRRKEVHMRVFGKLLMGVATVGLCVATGSITFAASTPVSASPVIAHFDGRK